MGFRPLADTRISVLTCDACDGVLAVDGSKAPKPYRESEPCDLAPHYSEPAELRAAAFDMGWANEGERWSCSDCSSASKPTLGG